MNAPNVMIRPTSFLDNDEPSIEYGLASQVLLVDKYPIAVKGFATVRFGTLFLPCSNENPHAVCLSFLFFFFDHPYRVLTTNTGRGQNIWGHIQQ